LPQVTLCAVDTRSPGLAAQSLQRSMAQADFGRSVLFTSSAWQASHALPGIEVVAIESLASGADYSHFVLRKLPAYIDTSHVLVTQWDGFVVDGSAWTDAFLDVDFIGAVWHDQPASLNVGNGGFSLRSQRCLQAGLDPRITQEHPEDVVLCRTHRSWLESELGLRFAAPGLAQRFAFENITPSGPSFGFHGPYHLPRVLDQATLCDWLDALPDPFFRSRDARRLARALLARRMGTAARQLVQRRRGAGMDDAKTRLLGVAAGVVGWLPSPPSPPPHPPPPPAR
jgi:hypothetical protein